VIWSPTGKSCIGYRVLSGVMLAAGDPIGDPEAWPGAIHAFLDEAARHAWVPAVVGCGEQGAEVWCREGGLAALELGDEAVVTVDGFSLEGRAMRNVRQMVTRVARNGYTAEFRRTGELTKEELRALAQLADSWRGGSTERGFSMALGRIGGVGDERCVLATAMENGELRAIQHFVPWGKDGLSLDLMRRDKSAAAGVNDFLIVEAIKAAPELGVRRISLNFAAFRSALERGERIGAGPVLQVQREVPAGLDPPVHGLPQHRLHAADRAGRAGGRGVPGLAADRGPAAGPQGRPGPAAPRPGAAHDDGRPPGRPPGRPARGRRRPPGRRRGLRRDGTKRRTRILSEREGRRRSRPWLAEGRGAVS
jgi:hypothetical protein